MLKNISPAEQFTRTIFGVLMIGSFFFYLGRWLMLLLGILFLISAFTGYCVTCELYKKLWGECKDCTVPPKPQTPTTENPPKAS